MAFIEASKTGSKGGGDGVPVGALMTFSGEELPEGYEPAETEEQISIQQLNDNLTQYDMNNSQYLTDKFRFATKDGKDGYIKKVLGADTFFPFKSVGTEVTVTIDANGFFHINDANNYDIYILDITAGDNTLAEVTGHITISTITNANATLLSQEAKQYGRYYGTSLYIVERTNTGEIIITPNNTASLQALGIVKAYGY